MMFARSAGLISIAMLAFACGSSGGGGGGSNPDARTSSDALGMTADAPNAAADGLGKVCDQTHMCPTTGATMCAALSMTATHGFCTLSCGTTPSSQMTPPTGGDMMCASAMPASPEGTPICAIHGPAAMNKFTWYCALGCGSLNGQNLGQCPAGLTCTSNICQ